MLEIRDASGLVVVNTTRGPVWGQVTKGRLTVTDPTPGDGLVFVSGADPIQVSDNVTSYKGKYLHFRVTGGKAKLSFKGTGIDLTAVGVGTVTFAGDAFAADQGDFAVDSGKWNPVPVNTTTFRYGVQPAP